MTTVKMHIILQHFLHLRPLDFTSCLSRRRLNSRMSLKRSHILQAARIRKLPLVLVRNLSNRNALRSASALRLQVHYFMKGLFVFLVHSQPGSSQGSSCGLDQVPSPQSLISNSSNTLVKNEHSQVCVCLLRSC